MRDRPVAIRGGRKGVRHHQPEASDFSAISE
jgi:hypothetical protein